MRSQEIRQAFLDYFEDKKHKIVPSAPLVNKDDPTLMFINAGMNPFKDFFLGTKSAKDTRVADTQKCLRVSGKHNDLEEVGIDSYHHTLFEMLGNWSFGDYFKKEAIEWAWDFLTNTLSINPDQLYITIFEGDQSEGLEADNEAIGFWEKWISKDRILPFGKKDNFWEMGETGPCGPCSEIHIDIRPEDERKKTDGADLVNMDHPQVVEIWNLVFIQYNRKSDGSLEELPSKHIDTGMGFERLSMVMQGKTSSYDSDIFAPMIREIEQITGKTYTSSYEEDAHSDVAMRVIADHIRAVAFAIADGQPPENTGAGYVIKRILRRAVRYYFSFLDYKEPLLHKLIPGLAEQFSLVFPELKAQETFVQKRILAEEEQFLRTLDHGLKRLDNLQPEDGQIDGKTAFELYDTYGFPLDLTQLIVREKGWTVDQDGFDAALEEQRARSRNDAVKKVGDWIQVKESQDVKFMGYDLDETLARVVRYRTVEVKGKEQYQIVLDQTPFYPDGGGQIGDTGLLYFDTEKIPVLDTRKENDLIIHIVKNLPRQIDHPVLAVINSPKRKKTENNHTATHLVHAALRKVLGDHVQQKGSLVNDRYLRFDFSHFQKMTDEQIREVEEIVNAKIRENINREAEVVSIEEARGKGAMMLFGEKYGEQVRMITFDPDFSVELCGGCHVPQTGLIGSFRIISEESVASGVRRIIAVTAGAADEFINQQLDTLTEIKSLFKNPRDIASQVNGLQTENKMLKQQIEQFQMQAANSLKKDLIASAETINGVTFIGRLVFIDSSEVIKKLAFDMRKEVDNMVLVLGAKLGKKANLTVAISDSLIQEKSLNAGQMIRELAKEIKGGGGGQPHIATAGGKNPDGLENAIAKAKTML